MSAQKILAKHAQVLMVDIQRGLFPALSGAQNMLKRSTTLLHAAKKLAIPITAVEQNPEGLGHTVEPLQDFIDKTFTKTTFSGFEQAELVEHLNDIHVSQQRDTLILFGSEAHVCLLLTALGAKRAGYQTVVVWDATASRYPEDREIAKNRLLAAQCTLVSCETLVFEWLEDYQHPEFKSLIELIKQH